VHRGRGHTCRRRRRPGEQRLGHARTAGLYQCRAATRLQRGPPDTQEARPVDEASTGPGPGGGWPSRRAPSPDRKIAADRGPSVPV
jgi:hypothetical protein